MTDDEDDDDAMVIARQGRFEKVDPSSPERCKANNKDGQCPFRKQPNTDYCISHSAGKNAVRKAVHDFRLTLHQARVDEFAASKKHNTLKGEVGILRLQLEHIVNLCKIPNDFLAYSEKLINLVNIINKTLATSQILEEKAGLVLSKDKVLLIADRMVTIISEQITDSEMLEEIASKIGKLFEELQ